MPPVSTTILKSLSHHPPLLPRPQPRWLPRTPPGALTASPPIRAYSLTPIRAPRFALWGWWWWKAMGEKRDGTPPNWRATWARATMGSAHHHHYHAKGLNDGKVAIGNARGGGGTGGGDGNPVGSSRLLTLPTVLTLGRVAAVPLLVCTFYIDSHWSTTATTGVFLAAAITDWLDGYIARKMKLGTAFGAFLDPVADKLMVAATLVMLCTRPLETAVFDHVPWLLTVPSIAIIGREITMSAVREWAASQNSKLLEAVAVNNLGKWKTATQMVALTVLLLTRDESLKGASSLVASGVVLLYISAGLAVWSLGVYMSKIWRVLLK